MVVVVVVVTIVVAVVLTAVALVVIAAVPVLAIKQIIYKDTVIQHEKFFWTAYNTYIQTHSTFTPLIFFPAF